MLLELLHQKYFSNVASNIIVVFTICGIQKKKHFYVAFGYIRICTECVFTLETFHFIYSHFHLRHKHSGFKFKSYDLRLMLNIILPIGLLPRP